MHHKQEVHKVQGWMHFPYASSSEVGRQEGVLGKSLQGQEKKSHFASSRKQRLVTLQA